MTCTESKREWTNAVIHRLEEGGYMVQEKHDERQFFTPPMYACTTMKEALDYIKAKIGRGR